MGEEIRNTLKHSPAGQGMVPEAELLLMNAARAQLVRQVIRPALAAGEVVVCDRFYDSTVAYQGWGRGMDREEVERVIGLAVGTTRPDLTILLRVPEVVAAGRRRGAGGGGSRGAGGGRSIRGGGRAVFRRVEGRETQR